MKYLLSALILTLSSALAHADNGVVTLAARQNVANTMDKLETIVKGEKFQIFARVNFQELAAANNGKVNASQLLIFGKGGILPSLLPATPLSAIDLPFKILIWEDANGKTWLSYNKGEYLKVRHDISGKDDIIKRVESIMESLSAKAIE